MSQNLRIALVLTILGFGYVDAHSDGGIVTDGSLGKARQSFGGSDVEITQASGKAAGRNLFHSFSEFNVQNGQTVTFTEAAPNSFDNVISRVTGPSQSDIDGTLRSTPGGHADFYLINPKGVVIGANARIDVPAAFHISTSEEIRFPDGAKYSAVNANGTGLSSAPPSSFGFLKVAANTNSLLKVDGARLSAKTGQTLDLVGRQIQIENGARLRAPGGEIRIVAMSAPGQVSLNRDSRGTLPVPATKPNRSNAGPIALNDSEITSNGNGGGHVGVWGGKLTMRGTAVDANGFPTARITADNEGARAAASGAGIDVHAFSLALSNAFLSAGARASGSAGNITVKTTGPIQLQGLATVPDGFAGVLSQAEFGKGNAGNVKLSAGGKVSITNGAFVSTTTFTSGKGGNVRLSAQKDLVVNARNAKDSKGNARFTGITAQSDKDSSGDAGNVTVTVGGNLQILNKAQIVSTTKGLGRGGNVNITTHGDLTADPGGSGRAKRYDDLTGVTTGAGSPADSGNSDSPADDIQAIRETGNAGKVRITSDGAVIVKNGGEISSYTFGSGKGGSVSIDASRIQLQNSGEINARSNDPESGGQVGSVSLQASDRIQVLSGAKASLQNDAVVSSPRLIKPGALTMQAPDIRVRGGSVTSKSEGNVSAGNILLQGKTLTMDSGNIVADANSGNGGDIVLDVQSIVPSGNTVNGRELTGAATLLPGTQDPAPNNIVQAVSRTGVSGIVSLTAQQINLSGVLANLGNPAFDTGKARPASCVASPDSTLSIQGKGGLLPKGGDLPVN